MIKKSKSQRGGVVPKEVAPVRIARQKPAIKKYLFYAEVEKGHVIKVLIDFFSEFFSHLEITITPAGISMNRSDQKWTICQNTFLRRIGFGEYKCLEPEITIAFALNTLQKLLKNVKKKESLVIYLDEDLRLSLDIRSGSDSSCKKINKRSETVSIQTQRVLCKSDQSITKSPNPEFYNDPVVFNSCDFQKIKKLPYGEGSITVEMLDSRYLCISDQDELYSSKLMFGSLEDVEEPVEEEGMIYNKSFEKISFRKIAKITGLAKKIHFSCPKPEYSHYPLLIKTQVGDLGEMSIFLKDSTQLSVEEQNKMEMQKFEEE